MSRPRRILFVQYAHPSGFPPIERAARTFHASGWDVRIIGTRGLNTDSLGVEQLSAVDVRLSSRAGHGMVQKLQYLGFLLRGILHVIRWRPAWVYVSDPMATPVGLVAVMLGSRVAYHEHDAPVDERPSRFIRVTLAARRMLLRSARIVITPNDERSAAISVDASGRNVVTVWNCPLVTEVAAQRTPGPRSNILKLVYHGSIVPGRPPMTVIEAIARAEGSVELTIAGYEPNGARGHVAQLLRRASDLRVSDRITVLPAMPRHQLLRIAAASDIGLSFMPSLGLNSNERRMAGASNKAFEYLASGLALIVSDLPDWRRIFIDAHVAWACDPADVDAIVVLLNRALLNRDEVAAMGERGRRLVIDRWNYENRFAPVLHAISSTGR